MTFPERITARDLVSVGYCASGQRRWFSANRMDFAAFLKDGMATADFLAQGDDLAREAVERMTARERV